MKLNQESAEKKREEGGKRKRINFLGQVKKRDATAAAAADQMRKNKLQNVFADVKRAKEKTHTKNNTLTLNAW